MATSRKEGEVMKPRRRSPLRLQVDTARDRSSRRRRGLVVVPLVLGLVALAVFAGRTHAAPRAAAAPWVPTTNLSKVCPSTLVLQIDWFPEAEYGLYFSLIGPKGKLDAGKGWYTGPLGKTGVNLQIRSGGPFLGQQTVQSIMYQDNSINLGLVHTDDAIRFSKQFPMVGVVAPLEHSPLAVIWDPTKHNFTNWRQIGQSGASILVFTKAVNFVPFLVAKGLVPEKSFDDSFDGSYTRFVADTSLLQQAFVSETPYRLQHEIPQYGRTVGVMPVARSGYDPYLSTLSVRARDLKKMTPCLKKLVPIIQKADVNYITHPTVGNQVMVNVVTGLHSFWTESMPLLAFGNKADLQYKVISNGPDHTIGNFSMKRVQGFINVFYTVFGHNIATANASVAPTQIVTNQFIDPTIGLPATK
jgi:hypothetical protein